jgi:PAS domain S-box-containing protein
MDQIRDHLDELQRDETSVLARRMAVRSAQDSLARVLIAVSLLLGAGISGLSLVALNAETRRSLSAMRDARERAAQLDTTLRSIGDAVMTADAEGRITFINPVAEALTGWSLADARSKPIDAVFRIVNEETRATVESPAARVLREGVVVGLANHTVLLAKDGREIPIDDSGAPIRDAEGRTTGFVLVFRDVSERKQSEDERERLVRIEAAQVEAEKTLNALRVAQAHAEAANRSKDEFLAVLSHELRSPLNAMLGWVTLLKQGAVTGDKAVRALDIIERSVQMQTQLVNDLLDVSRIVSGKLTLDNTLVDLGAVVRSAVEDARSAAQPKNLELTLSIEAPGEVVAGLGDEKRIRQVLTNLIANAIKFTPKGGRVGVSLTRQGDEARIDVVDTGEGITPEFLPHVFDRFRQADASSTRQHGGLGLGLAIVKTLVELHGGRVEARSAGLGAGAQFTVRLPLRTEPPPLPSIPRERVDAASELVGAVAVLVDDDADTRDVLGFALEQQGIQVHACASAEEAMTLLGAVSPDVIVSDIGMPGEDGYHLMEQVRSLYGERSCAIAVTGFASIQDRAHAMLAGFDDHVAKPVNLDMFIGKIREAVRKRRIA